MSKRDRIEVIARGVLRRGPWVLACRNVEGGYWYLPGGHVEFGEAATVALARELKEETGLKVEVGRLLLAAEGTFRTHKREHHEINLVFHVEQNRGRERSARTPPPPVASREEHIAFDWVDLRKLDDVDLRPKSMRSWLARWFATGRSTERSTWNTGIARAPNKSPRR